MPFARVLVPFLTALFVIPSAGQAEDAPLRATTEDGRPVLLSPDGTWRFAPTETADNGDYRMALAAPTRLDTANGCRVTLVLSNLSDEETVDNFTPRVAFWRTRRVTPAREIIRFRDVAPGEQQEVDQLIRFARCETVERIEIATLQDDCEIGGVAYEDFECLSWTRPEPGVIPIELLR